MLAFLCSSWTEKHTENFGLIFIISISLHIYICSYIYIYIAKCSERNQDNGHYDGIGGDGFLCLTLPTSCQLQVKISARSRSLCCFAGVLVILTFFV